MYFFLQIPYLTLHELFYHFFRIFFKTEVVGFENYERIRNEKMVIIANHESFIDAPLIVSNLPDEIAFAIHSEQVKRWFVKPFLNLVKVISVNSLNPFAIKELINSVNAGDKLLIFPEGRITTTGSLMKMYPGAAIIAEQTDAYILPIRIENALNTFFSHFSFKRSLFPKITLHILPPEKLKKHPGLTPKERREKAKLELYKIMSNMIFETSFKKVTPLFEGLLEAGKLYGKHHVILEDVERKKWNYGRLIKSVYVFAELLPKNEKRIAILLPNVIPTVVVFFALHRKSITPVMLNYSTGLQNILTACKIAEIKTIVTSRKFVQRLNYDMSKLKAYKIVYLEDLKNELTLGTKLKGLLSMYFAPLPAQSMEDTAYVLFTSGSEGVPKGVVLTHSNIQANAHQMLSRFDFNYKDRFFNTLPMFHSFGLTCGTVLPILQGMKVFLFPNPLEFRLIPELLYDTNSTVMFATNSFLKGYARFASAYDFHWIRAIFAGAEKLQDETRDLYATRFGKQICEGYGTTEASPVVSVNSQMFNKVGTVGLFLPGVKHKLEPIEGIHNGGLLHIAGPNLMKQYLGMPPLGDSYYNTGDIVSIDNDGFITIVGRLKRFAKIHGEMVDLTFLESLVQKIWDNFEHAAIAKATKLGEEVHLFTTSKDVTLDQIATYVKQHHYSILMVPKRIHIVEKMPRLGSGKIDYVTLATL